MVVALIKFNFHDASRVEIVTNDIDIIPIIKKATDKVFERYIGRLHQSKVFCCPMPYFGDKSNDMLNIGRNCYPLDQLVKWDIEEELEHYLEVEVEIDYELENLRGE